MFSSRYESQVDLLLQCLPEVMMHPCFALKGGSAINLFVRDMPRLSVDIPEIYKNDFQGMTRVEFTLEELEEVQKTLASTMVDSLDKEERAFLLSVKQGEADWNLLGIDNLERFPAIQWKLMNIRKMAPQKCTAALDKLKRILDV